MRGNSGVPIAVLVNGEPIPLIGPGETVTVVDTPGDLDDDGDVDQDDLAILVACFGQPPSACVGVAPGVNPDFNGDDVINILDVSFVGSNFTP